MKDVSVHVCTVNKYVSVTTLTYILYEARNGTHPQAGKAFSGGGKEQKVVVEGSAILVEGDIGGVGCPEA